MAEDQFAGRGQFSNSWFSEPGKNLTFSILLYPSFLAPSQLFRLNVAVSIAINDALNEIIGSRVKIKWPNDIFFADNKIGGILIENSISGTGVKHSIIGIGLNVNQTEFAGLGSVTSVKCILAADADRTELLRRICSSIERRYKELQNNQADEHLSCYLQNLYRFNEIHTFVAGGNTVYGKIIGVDPDGRLQIECEGTVKSYGLKELSYVI